MLALLPTILLGTSGIDGTELPSIQQLNAVPNYPGPCTMFVQKDLGQDSLEQIMPGEPSKSTAKHGQYQPELTGVCTHPHAGLPRQDDHLTAYDP